MADIIKHSDIDDVADAPGHPIPSLCTLDVCTLRKGGGAVLDIVVASPLGSDERSLTRLLDKIEVYLQHIHTPEFVAEAGEPSAAAVTIVVNLHSGSCQEAFELLDKSRAWVADNDATLVVTSVGPQETS